MQTPQNSLHNYSSLNLESDEKRKRSAGTDIVVFGVACLSRRDFVEETVPVRVNMKPSLSLT